MSARRLRLVAAAAALAGFAALVVAGVIVGGRPDETASGLQASGDHVRGPQAGAPAPDLVGTNPVTGERVDLADFTGQPVVLNVWASWCPGCIAEAADLRRFAAKHPEAVVLGLDYQDTKAAARDFYRDWGWKHPSIFDPRGELAARLALAGLPTTIFLNRRHREVVRVVGESDLADFERGLEQAKAAA